MLGATIFFSSTIYQLAVSTCKAAMLGRQGTGIISLNTHNTTKESSLCFGFVTPQRLETSKNKLAKKLKSIDNLSNETKWNVVHIP